MAGQGYTRQSSGVIITNNTIEASHFNDEYNALQGAFNATAGHSHDGSVGNAPAIVLTTSVSGELPLANGGTGGTDAATARASLGVDVAGTDNSTPVTFAGTGTYITLSGQEITVDPISLTGDVTGTLPLANGGSNATTAAGARTSFNVDVAGTDNSTDVTIAAGRDYVTISGQQLTLGFVNVTTDITGIVPTGNLGTGTADATTFLRGDGTWTVGGGDMLAANNLSDVLSAATSRTNLGLGSLAVLNTVNNTNWSGSDLTVANGGTGSSTASAARTALGLAIGSDVQAFSTILNNTTGTFLTADQTKLDGIATNANLFVHPTSPGNVHLPSGGAANGLLQFVSSGTATWIVVTRTTSTTPPTGGADGDIHYIHEA